MDINIGINGLGRIGKSILIQLLNEKNIKIKVLNILDYDINSLENYLKYDSIHKYSNNFEYKIINKYTIEINNNLIYLFNEKDVTKLNWKDYDIKYVIDSTGQNLTSESLEKYNVDYVIMCAPPKDNTSMYIKGVNSEEYIGEKIVSNSSCTTNSITPLLKILNNKYGIVKCNFTTIHSVTASQTILDKKPNKNNRIYRSYINNIIPYTTGASESIEKLMPEIKGKIKGTSIRVPVNNVSLIDCNIELKKKTSLNDLLKELKNYDNIEINENKLVSSDYITTLCPTIIDSECCMDLNNNEFKLMIWYDNEWSYSNQLIKLLKTMIKKNKNTVKINNKYFIENYNFKNKKVLCRFDYNIPIKNNIITDTYRIDITIPTIKKILKNNPLYLIITTHFGRPKYKDEKYSVKFLQKILEKKIERNIIFLENGFSKKSLEKIINNIDSPFPKIYLMENVRFHEEEINMNDNYKNFINKFCDIYVNDAFGCCHRKHSSIIGFDKILNLYGYTIKKETEILDNILYSNKKKLAIIGGGKMDTKLELIRNLSKKMDTIYICGGNINSILKNNYDDYLEEINNNKANIYFIEDGYKSKSLNDDIFEYSLVNNLYDDEYFYDCGHKSIDTLNYLINNHDIIFWNGVCGVIEKKCYSLSSLDLLNILVNENNKEIIIAGGDTVSFVNNNLSENKNNIKFLSGGGSSVDYLANGTLIGLKQFI